MNTYQQIQKMTDEELLQVLIREKAGGDTVKRLLENHQTLPDLFAFTEPEELSAVKGIGVKKILMIKAVFELARRLNEADYLNAVKIKCPEDIFNAVRSDMQHLSREVFMVLLLNTKHQVMHKEIVSVGSLNASIVHPREVFKLAVKKSASAMILIHNHPSGDPTPSNEDIQITKRLVDAGGIMGISVLDHVIVGGGQYLSFREQEVMTF